MIDIQYVQCSCGADSTGERLKIHIDCYTVARVIRNLSCALLLIPSGVCQLSDESMVPATRLHYSLVTATHHLPVHCNRSCPRKRNRAICSRWG